MNNMRILVFCCLLSFASCTKPSNTTNNYITNDTTRIITQLPASNPAYIVDGINDISLDHTNNSGYTTLQMPLTIQYEDSIQQTVTVSVSGIPPTSGGTANGQFASGVPTFNCILSFVYNVDFNKIPLGTYPITVTCTGSISGTKSYKFNFVVY